MRQRRNCISSGLVLCVLAGSLLGTHSGRARAEEPAPQAPAHDATDLGQLHQLSPAPALTGRREQAIREIAAASLLLATGVVLIGFGADQMTGDPYRRVGAGGELSAGALGLGLLLPGVLHVVPAAVLFADGIFKYRENPRPEARSRWSLAPYVSATGSGLAAAGRF